jgi:hypothetical protein
MYVQIPTTLSLVSNFILRHCAEELRCGRSIATQVFPSRHRFFHLYTGFPISTQVFQSRHSFSCFSWVLEQMLGWFLLFSFPICHYMLPM